MSYEIKFTSQFEKDLKLAQRQHKDLDKLFETVKILPALLPSMQAIPIIV